MRLDDENRMLPERISAHRLPRLSPGASEIMLMPAAGDGPGEGDMVSTSELARVLRRRMKSILLTVSICVGAATLASVLATPLYRARTTLQIDTPNESLFLREVTPVSAAAPESYFNNQMKLLASDTLARRVADKLGIRAPVKGGGSRLGTLVRETPDEEDLRIAIVKSAIRTRTSLQSQVVELTFDAGDPRRAAQGANVTAAEFIELNREARDKMVQNTTEWLTREAAVLKTKLDQSRRDLEAYMRGSGLVFAAGPSTLAEEHTRQTQQALAAAQTDRVAKQARYEVAVGSSIEALPDVVATGAIREYQMERERLRREIADLTAVLTPAHYRVQRLNSQLAEVNDSIKRERNEILGRLRADFQSAAALEQRLAAAHTQRLTEAGSQAGKAAAYAVRKHEIDTTQALYDSMLTRVKEAGVASALRATNVRVIDPARPPWRPYRPNVPLNVALGLAMGLTGGVALAFMRERSGRVSRPGDVVLLDVPELGVIPSARDDRGLENRRSLIPAKPNGDLALVTWHHETSLLSEAYRATLASILFSSAASESVAGGSAKGRVLLVAGAEAMVGKTTVLTNLGIALAETGRRVLLVDADLRRPRLHEVFDICNDWGLTDLLQNPRADYDGSVETVARSSRVPNVWVLPSGPGTATIPRLLHSPNLHVLLMRLRALFDFVLVDSAPTILYSDSRVLGRESDGVVVVARANLTSRDTLRSTCARLHQDGIPVLGTVLNDWRIDRSEYPTYGYYYRGGRRAHKAG